MTARQEISYEQAIAVAREVCTPEQIEVLELRALGLGWRRIAEAVYQRTGRYPARSTVRDRWESGWQRIVNAIAEGEIHGDD